MKKTRHTRPSALKLIGLQTFQLACSTMAFSMWLSGYLRPALLVAVCMVTGAVMFGLPPKPKPAVT